MKSLCSFKEIYFYQAPVDMRKQINGLSIIVEKEMLISPFQDALFLFLNQSGTIVKLLYWDRNGFAIWTKRLEKHRYAYPLVRSGTKNLLVNELEALLQGLNIFQQGHPELFYKKIC